MTHQSHTADPPSCCLYTLYPDTFFFDVIEGLISLLAESSVLFSRVFHTLL